MANECTTQWAHCNTCGHDTKHKLIAEREVNRSQTRHEGYDVEWSATYRMLECCGCEDVITKADYWHSEVDLSEDSEYFPPRVSRRMPNWANQLPNDWRQLMYETYTALHANSRRLAMMGARTLIDLYMNETVGDVGGFEQKLKALTNGGFLAEMDRGLLNAALNAGSASAHRGHNPTFGQITSTMDIVENLLQKYPLQKSAAELSKSIPTRVKPQKG